MSSTTQITTFSDAYTDLLNRVRADTAATATITQAKRYINVALQDMHIGFAEKVPWAERRSKVTLRPLYSTGTVAITRGTTALTGTSTLWTTTDDFGVANARVGGKVVIAGGSTVYTVTAVGGATSITLDQKYVGTTETAASYTYFEDEYDLASDFLRPVDINFFDENASISVISRTEFRRRFPRNDQSGSPIACCFQDHPFSGNTTPVRKIRFARIPAQYYAIPYSYITANLVVSALGVAQAAFSADSDEPIVPLRYRHAIVFHALYHWYRDKKDDARSQEAKAEYTDLMLRLGSDQEVGSPRPRIVPRTEGYKRRARSPWGAGSVGRRYDVNGAFDRME